MRRSSVWGLLLAAAMLFAAFGQVVACTGISLQAADGSVVRGRTMEFGNPLDSDVILIPRGMAFTGTTPDGKADGLNWTATYAAAGANAMKLPIIVDGLNERGLGGGMFYFPGFAGYQSVSSDDRLRAIAPWELLNWALTQYATVDEVKAALPKIVVGPAKFGPWGIVPPVHYFLEDASGKSIVIEYVDGAAHVYDDPLGVLTNAPGFDWHLTNLRNYINVSPDAQSPVTLDNLTLDPLSTGGNLFGLPGDFSSPARFVRAVVYSHLMPQAPTSEEAVTEGFHILDNFDIPRGSVPEPKGSNPPYETTEWTTMSDLTYRTFYIWTNDNRAIRTLDLTKIDLAGPTVQTFALDQPQTFVPLGG